VVLLLVLLLLMLVLMLMLMLLAHGLSVDRGDISTTRVPVGEPRNLGIGCKGTMREACITVGGLRSVAVPGALASLRARQVLHPEQMRRDKTVPSDVG
jgi:hypothetical protein